MNSPKSSHNIFEGRQRNLSPVELLKELQEIKDHDEALRQKTIQLLKKGNWFWLISHYSYLRMNLGTLNLYWKLKNLFFIYI